MRSVGRVRWSEGQQLKSQIAVECEGYERYRQPSQRPPQEDLLAMIILIGKGCMARLCIARLCIAFGALLIGVWPSAGFAERSIEVVILNLKLTCDPDQCRTPVLEVQEHTGVDANYVEYVFASPPGVALDEARITGVEVDGEGATHYVRALAAGPGSLKCKWLAQARPGGDNGLAKGYCWIAIKK